LNKVLLRNRCYPLSIIGRTPAGPRAQQRNKLPADCRGLTNPPDHQTSPNLSVSPQSDGAPRPTLARCNLIGRSDAISPRLSSGERQVEEDRVRRFSLATGRLPLVAGPPPWLRVRRPALTSRLKAF
jgi:hypothetical protein